MMYLAPGYWLLPLRTSSCSLKGLPDLADLSCPEVHLVLSAQPFFYLSILKGVTISGNVILAAMERGTPTWSICRLGSGVMTVRAEKSTRLPIRLPRTLPSFPLRRCFMDFKGRPDFCIACEKKNASLNTSYLILCYVLI